MPTFTALTTLSEKQSAQALGAAMERLDPEPMGVGVFELEDGSGLWEVGAYFTQAPDDTALAILVAAFDAASFAVSKLPETDWVAKVKRELKPVKAGRFFVYGSHDADQFPPESIALLIEAAMAFGTGHHGTTLGCLRALDRLAETGFEGRNVIDVGCGTAVLAMAAASIWSLPVLASDIDKVAVDVAHANVVSNQLEGRVKCLEAAGFDHPDLSASAPYDLVFANILKGPLIDLAPAMADHITEQGYAILSGILTEQADQVTSCYAKAGFALVQREDIGEWSTLTLCKSQ